MKKVKEDEVKSWARKIGLVILNLSFCYLLFLVFAPVVNKWGIVNLIKGLALLNAAVMFHEFGHLVAGKRAGLKIEAFAIGMGPILLRYSKWGIEWRLCLYPVGGYVKSEGETPFQSATPKQAIRYAWGGPFASLLTCFVAIFVAGLIGGGSTLAEPLVVSDVISEHAQKAGLKKGDLLLKADGIDLTKDAARGLQKLNTQLRSKEATTITFNHEGVEHTKSVELMKIDGEQRIGVRFGLVNAPLGFSASLMKAVRITGILGATPVVLPYALITEPRNTVEGSGGPGTLVTILIKSLQGDVATFLFIFGIINGALGGFQLIPIIPFDGGHIMTALVRITLRNKPKEVLNRLLNWYILVSIVVTVLILRMAIMGDLAQR